MVDRILPPTAVATSGYTVYAGWTMSDWGIIVGIVGTVITVAVTVWSKIRRDRREEEAHAALLAARLEQCNAQD